MNVHKKKSKVKADCINQIYRKLGSCLWVDTAAASTASTKLKPKRTIIQFCSEGIRTLGLPVSELASSKPKTVMGNFYQFHFYVSDKLNRSNYFLHFRRGIPTSGHSVSISHDWICSGRCLACGDHHFATVWNQTQECSWWVAIRLVKTYLVAHIHHQNPIPYLC